MNIFLLRIWIIDKRLASLQAGKELQKPHHQMPGEVCIFRQFLNVSAKGVQENPSLSQFGRYLYKLSKDRFRF